MLYYIDKDDKGFTFTKVEGNYSFHVVNRDSLFEVINGMEEEEKELYFRFSPKALEDIDQGFKVPLRYKWFIGILYIIAISLLLGFCFSY